ncbi:hypothetical protein GCM10019059_21190 [Camelimonas fluminis]|nr:hypothetical protein GCM10019059_21190 [Camelimonas fluminis]
MTGQSQQPWGSVGRQRDVEGVERLRQTQAQRLDHRLFARPATIKTLQPVPLRQTGQLCQFRWRERVTRHVLFHRAHLLHVDADGAAPADGEGAEVLRMAEIDERRACFRQFWLAPGIAGEDKIPGSPAECFAQDTAHGAMGDDVAVAMPVMNEPRGALPFVCRQQAGEHRARRRRGLQAEQPDGDVATGSWLVQRH